MSAKSIARDLDHQRHRLQRLASPSKGFSGAVHALGLISFYSSFRFLVQNPNVVSESFGWHLQYLTIIGLAFATLCFTFGILADITSSRTLFTLKNYLAIIAAPIEIVISILYWGLRAIDPALVMPPDLPPLPFSEDLAFHLFPTLLLSLDFLLLSPPWPTSPSNPNAPFLTFLVSTAVAFLYWFWIELCYKYNGFYPYPIFDLLSTWQRVILFAASAGVMWVVGTGLRAVYGVVNGREGLEGETVDELEKEMEDEDKKRL